jgi:alkylation response protein AidB-like acyl-CoA dehydrogenase
MYFELSEEQRRYQAAVRDFCQKEIAPCAAHADETGELPWAAIRKMPTLGLTAMQAPESDGGAALDTVSVALAIEEMGAACGSTGLSLAAHNGLSVGPLARWGTPAQKARWLPALMSGETLGSLALTEPDAGSDLLGGAKTQAVRDGDSWVINGHKAWITNVSFAPVIIVLCKTNPAGGSGAFSLLLVERETAGVKVSKPEKKMGLKASPTHQILFEDVRIPAENVLGEVGRGFQQTMQILDGGRITIAALSIGLARAAYTAAIRYAQQRQAFGKPIAQHQAIQWMLADAEVELEAARLLTFKAAWLKDQGADFSKAAAMAKLKASEVAEKICFHAIQIHGSYGYSAEFPVERIYRDQRLMTIGEGTSEIQRLVIARKVLEANRL